MSSGFWFPAKTYGWGWGLPVRWQGWAVFVGYLALLYLGTQFFREQRGVRSFLAYVLALTAGLIVVVVVKGERPAGWRWGK